MSFVDIQEIPSVSRLVTDLPAVQTEGESSLPSNLSWSSTEDCEVKEVEVEDGEGEEEEEEEENGPSVLRRLSPNILFSLQSPASSERTSRTTSRQPCSDSYKQLYKNRRIDIFLN